jgi:predicted nicotinamide N-methyase
VLARRLANWKPTEFVNGRTVQALELGSGTGIVGISAAAIWGAHVFLTDLPSIAPNLARNISENTDLIQKAGGQARAGVLDWTCPESIYLSQTKERNQEQLVEDDDDIPSKFPVVLVADCIYSEQHPKLLARAILQWLQPGRESRVLVELPLRTGFKREIDSFRIEMECCGLAMVRDEEDIGYDDWGSGKGDGLVTCWFSLWAWANDD